MELRLLRRKGKIDATNSIYINYDKRFIGLDTDDGRICRPLIVVENGKCSLTKDHLKLIKEKKRSF